MLHKSATLRHALKAQVFMEERTMGIRVVTVTMVFRVKRLLMLLVL